MEDEFVCCVLPNQTITQLNQLEAQLFNCSRFKTDLELYSQLVRLFFYIKGTVSVISSDKIAMPDFQWTGTLNSFVFIKS